MERLSLHWQYQMSEKSRDRRVSLILLMEVADHKNLNITPCHTFSFDGQWKKRWLAESFEDEQSGREKSQESRV